MAVAAAGELAEIGVGDALEETGPLIRSGAGEAGESIEMTPSTSWGGGEPRPSWTNNSPLQSEGQNISSTAKSNMNKPGIGNKSAWSNVASSAINALGNVGSAAITGTATKYSADQSRNASIYNSDINYQIANVKANNNLALQSNQYAFTKSMFNEAEQQLTKAGLPSYVLFTNGTMPSVQTHLGGTSSTVKVPLGTSSQWWRAASQF